MRTYYADEAEVSKNTALAYAQGYLQALAGNAPTSEARDSAQEALDGIRAVLMAGASAQIRANKTREQGGDAS